MEAAKPWIWTAEPKGKKWNCGDMVKIKHEFKKKITDFTCRQTPSIE
jgi:hypothetical protein